MKGRGNTRAIQPEKRTTTAVGQRWSEAWAVGWDKDAGHGQHRQRLDSRLTMGQKKTPLGPGKLRP